jgi:two-component system, NtrC family, nitrogen regulation sensor histidine kinase NtrY
LKNNISLKRLFINNSYLLAAAAWFITLSFIIDNYWSDKSSDNAVKKRIESYVLAQENDFDKLTSDTLLINTIVQKKYDETLLKQLFSRNYFFYVYSKSAEDLFKLEFWSSQVVEPDGLILTLDSKSGFMQLANGYYVWRKQQTGNLISLALIPVKWNYSITNEYLKNTFATGYELENYFTISDDETINPVTSKEGNFLFSLKQKLIVSVAQNNIVAAILRILAGVLILLFVQILAVYFVQRNFYTGVLFLAIVLAALRFISYYFSVPINFRQYELFDPGIYATNSVMRSLGDLLINAVFFIWMVLFTRHYMQENKIAFNTQNKALKWVIVLAGVAVLLVSTFTIGNLIRSMVSDSQISFDVVNFFTLSVYSAVGFVVLGSLATGFFLLSQIVIYLLQPLFPKRIVALILLVTIVGLAFLTIRISQPSVKFELYLLIWLLIYLILLNSRQLYFFAAEIISSRLIFWLFFFSISISLVIMAENNIKETEKRKKYAEALSTKADPSSERLMNTVLTDFRSEALAPLFSRFKTEASNKLIKDSLLNENFTGYLNKYDTRIYTFDNDERPLYNQDSATFNTLATILKTEGKPTAIADLYYYDVSYDHFSYISKKSISDSSGKLLGYVFIIASPKRYKTDALYPELFLKGYNNSIENSPIYSFAVYNNLKLVTSHNDYAFPSHLLPGLVPVNDFESHTKTGYNELWYKAGVDKVVIITKRQNLFIESITLFSYLFCAFLFVTGFFWLLNSFISSRLHWGEIRRYWQMSIRNQVHATIIFMSLLSFVIIGVVTFLFFIDRYNNNNRDSLSRTIRVMQNEVRNSLAELTVFDDVITLYDMANRDKLEQIVSKISEVHAVDINLYDLDGNLKVSSLPLPYNKKIVSELMDPEAYYHLNTLKEIQFFKNEKIGTLKYLSNYVPVLDENGHQYAYLNIPYFTSQTKLWQEISNFLMAIINLNVFIFLIAGIVALFITNRITRSFSFISNKMKQVNLGQINEAIQWKRKDEIGELVIEYNKMVAKLDESAMALAKSEREGAWREMARQVAHEIKNPLTPMKLSLQYLQKAIDSNTGDVTALSKSVAKTLVEQIDHLSQIAGEFSQFANIGNPRMEVFDLNESMDNITYLHNAEENLQLHWQPLEQAVMIKADKTHINRLFTNLIQNAMQAVPEERTPNIRIEEKLLDHTVLITIKDNGNGIPASMKSKIFTPNFTTKTSGTGLGLAMCKGIVEQSKGNIWFDTEEGKGTTFYVELPVV